MICSIEGCENFHYVRGWCSKHWKRWWMHGDPNILKRPEDGELIQYALIHMYDGCCYSWPYMKNSDGRPNIWFNGKQITVANFVCEQIHGPAPPDKPNALHKCGKGHLGCFNAECLYWGSKKDNMQDAIEAGTWAHGETSGRVKLSTEQIEVIRRLYATGTYSQYDLADMFHVNQSQISRIIGVKSRRNG